MVTWSARGRTGDVAPASWSVALNEDGLVCGAGSVLARMSGPVGQPRRLALDRDGDRLLAMLSIVVGRPISADDVLPHVAAASAHWQRGDKALANLRLVFARLPRPGDPAAVERLAKAERLLDGGMAPDSLMKALWQQRVGDDLRRYNPAQPRVPTGHGVESGRWTVTSFNTGVVSFEDGRIVVAANPGGVEGESSEEAKFFEERERLGLATPAEEFAHGKPINPLVLPMEIGPGPFARQSIPAGPSPNPGRVQRRGVNETGDKYGCHTCGTKDPGTPNGNWVADHQDPTSLVDPETPQRYFPQCLRCSQRQGGLIRAYKARRGEP